MRILIIGQTTLHWGRMEFGNIGNYYIIEPFVRELHKVFPHATIATTLQMSDRFCNDEKIEVLPIDYYYDFNTNHNVEIAKKEIEFVDYYLNNRDFLNTTGYIEEVLNSDIVIDFSGDIWGDNADFLGSDRFEVGLYKDMVAQKLGKPTFLLAGSPGPFKNQKTRALAKKVFEGFTLVTNREPISTQLLEKDGFDLTNVRNLACPAFLFEPAKDIGEIFKRENLYYTNRPLVGFVVCGWNFTEGPFNKWPRSDDEYIIFSKAIEYLTNELGVKVCLFSHSNGFPIPPKEFKLEHGRDYPIIKQLQKVIQDRGIAENVIAFDGIFDAWTTKAIISHFEMLVSGRVHAAVAGLSQCIPTVIIDYGHEPKAHKLKGFAHVAMQDDYVCDPSDEKDVISKVNSCWKSKDKIKAVLENRMPKVKEMARENFVLVEKMCRERGVL